MTLTPFSRSQEVKERWKMPCLHSISKRDQFILNQTCTDVSLGNAKRVDKILMTLTLFSMSQKVKECWKNSISWRDKWIITKSEQIYILEVQKNLWDFGDLDPIFQGHRKSKNVEKCLVSTLSPEWIDITTNALRHGKELVRFWWPWPNFTVTGGQ